MPELTEHELETAKMYHDAFKHLTTFSSGAILLSSSVVAAFFKNQEHLWFLYFSLTCFLFSAAFATMGLFATVNHLDNAFRSDINEAMAERRQQQRSDVFKFSTFAAYGGVLAFAVFAALNAN